MGAVSPSRYTVMAGWDDVPHLDDKTKAELLASIPPYLRGARSTGTPSLGAGAIYPVQWEDITVAPFQIPNYWKRSYGMDVGWNRTAALWLAQDPLDNTLYGYSEYYRGQTLPVVHAEGIKARGEWMTGEIDPASNGRAQKDGEQLLAQYREHGLNLTPAINAVEAGLYEVWSLIETGRLKFFNTLRYLPAEYRLYRRDENGKIIKENDHILDAMRYGVMGFSRSAKAKPADASQFSTGTSAGDSKVGY